MELSHPEKKSLDDKEMFAEVVQTILSVMGDDVSKIILYGSVARGDNTWESDVDIAVLTRREMDDREEANLSHHFTPLDLKYDTLFSIKCIDENRFNKWLFDLSFYYNIDEDGIILWKREAA